MTIFLLILAAVCGYLVAGFNPAIALSKLIYRKDIRECGSGNPGFTNFKRTFGNRWAWWVLALDHTKAAVVVSIFAWLLSKRSVDFQIGAAYTGLFCMLGHAYPVQYGFKGGKGFLVCLSLVWVIDFRAGLVATLIMIVLLLTTKFMSLSTMVAMLTSPVLLGFLGSHWLTVAMVAACALFMTWRHKENIKRLCKGTESKFYLKHKA